MNTTPFKNGDFCHRQPGGPEHISEEAVAAAAMPGALGTTNSTHACCAELDGIHTEHGEAVIAPYLLRPVHVQWYRQICCMIHRFVNAFGPMV